MAIDPAFWRSRRVLITGHTGFKGAWLCLWLQALGARVTGFSQGLPTSPVLYELAGVQEGMHDVILGDVRDAQAVIDAFVSAKPEVVFHLAAQPFVRRSYAEPRETFHTNVMGTVNVLDAVRLHPGSVRAIVSVTSDKCYENGDSPRAYREEDPLGGHDPYSASKGAAEVVTAAYRRSFFSDPDGPRVASARAGNVIGGGDWAEDRLVPDVMRAALGGEAVHVRNPKAVRPWQHVLCPLQGYLLLAQALWASADYASAWNFGPAEQEERPVGWVVERISQLWPGGVRVTHDPGPHPHEAPQLQLDSTRARARLGWLPAVDLVRGLELTVDWYRAFGERRNMRDLTISQIEACATARGRPRETEGESGVAAPTA